MTPEQFCYWFQGFAELNPEPPTKEQWQAMREHVETVFKKVTPPLQPTKIPVPKEEVKPLPQQPSWLGPFEDKSWPPKGPEIYC